MQSFVRFSGICALVFILCSCATSQPKQEISKIFFPPPPELPRLQYLKSYTSGKDIEPPQSAFDSFVTGGEKKTVRLDKPYGLAAQKGKIYVCDTNSTVMVFDLQQNKFAPLEGAKGLGKLVQPINIKMDSAGNKFVTDPIRGQVVMYDEKDFYVKSFGMSGVWKPVDAFPFADQLYVVDAKNSAIRVFDIATGEVTKVIGKDGTPEELLGLPTNLAIDSDGILYVSDAGRFQIVKYDRDGHYLGTIGEIGQNPGFFARPRGVAVDKKGRVYVVDAAFDNVQIFDKSGQLLLFFGEAGLDPGDMYLPAAVSIDYDNFHYFQKDIDPNFEVEHLVLVSNQFGHRLANIYAFGKEKGKEYPSNAELRKIAESRVEEWQAQNEKQKQNKGEEKREAGGEK